MIQQVRLGNRSYEILLEKGGLNRCGEVLDLNRKVLVVTDSGVPKAYAQAVAGQCKDPVICVIGQGEEHKTLQTWEELLHTMLLHGFSRKDCVAAVGGGVCGDLAGFAAASYMRGIDFYNLPTTLLAQVDSSVGGKTAVNLGGIKNIVGAFHQPRKVLIDVNVLETLPERHISSGFAEMLKMAVTFDAETFGLLESAVGSPGAVSKPVIVDRPVADGTPAAGSRPLNDEGPAAGGKPLNDEGPAAGDTSVSIHSALASCTEEMIGRILQIKKTVVEQDETEQGLRRVLNFGHTIGHGIESLCRDGSLYHGECVALGMLPMCSPEIRERLLPIYQNMHLPVFCRLDPDRVLEAMLHDKKSADGRITIVETDRIGTWKLRSVEAGELRDRISMVVHG